MEELKYPIGRFHYEGPYTEQQRSRLISEIAQLPSRLSAAVEGLNDEQLDTAYRTGGWTVRQLVHHIADSHVNSYIRFKLALTEDTPLIKPYDENRWADLYDGLNAPLHMSLNLLHGVHARWVLLLETMTPVEFSRAFNHPDNGITSLDKALGTYAWHGNHHLAHITSLKKRLGW